MTVHTAWFAVVLVSLGRAEESGQSLCAAPQNGLPLSRLLVSLLKLCAYPRCVVYNTGSAPCSFPAVLEEQGRSCWTTSSSMGSPVLDEA